MKKILALAFSLTLAACGGDKDKDKDNDNDKGNSSSNEGEGGGGNSGGGGGGGNNTALCQEAGLFIYGVAKRQCDTMKDCEACKNIGLGLLGLGMDAVLKCEETAQRAADACLKNRTRCGECTSMLVKAQCEGSKPSEEELAECNLFNPGLPF